MSSYADQNPLLEGDSEDEFDWEEVQVPEHEPQHLEITLQARSKPDVVKQKKGLSHAERLIRIECHKIHTIVLLGNAHIRNKWINDPLLHARLMSLTPLSLQNAFGMIHKSRVPDQLHRGRMFENAMVSLVQWWASDFFEVVPEGHLRNRTFDEVQKRMDLFIKNDQNPDEPLDLETLQDVLDDDGEKIRSEKSLMKHALMQSGSRDTSAQLFTALCRALGIPARLVASLQSVPWKVGVGKPKPKYERKPKGSGKGKGKQKVTPGSNEDAGMEEMETPQSASGSVSGADSIRTGKSFESDGHRLDGGPVPTKSEKAKGKEKAKPDIKLRRTKSKGRTLGSSSQPPHASSSRLESPDPTITPPVFWTEVFSRPDGRWLPVDPIRAIVNKRKIFDPSPSSIVTVPVAQTFGSTGLANPYAVATVTNRVVPRYKEENRLVYVLAFEEDGYARDVTRRYAKEYGAKVAKMQGGNLGIGSGGKGRQAWWDRVVNAVKRPYQLHRDDIEDEELRTAQMMEGMPSTITGFKDHPLYVLTRHLKQTETIHPAPPSTPELGKFRGEPVYPRSAVVSLKTSENWMRSEGRMVKAGCQPIKFIKARAGTVNRMRELEFMKDGLKDAGSASPGPGTPSGGEMMQGLYARSQTEPYVPNPVVDGKVPKNNFGNIDLYVPSMLPKGGTHIPFKGIAKIARKLGFDFSEAVTGFEFKKRRAFPIIEGVVVAVENEPALLEAYWEAEQEAEMKALAKREDRVLKQWARLIHGLRIRKRLQEQYATKPDGDGERSSQQPLADESTEGMPVEAQRSVELGGGFLADADDVVEAFHLPNYQHVPMAPTLSSKTHIPKAKDDQRLGEAPGDSQDLHTYDLETMDVDSDMEEIPIQPSTENIPKTMQELADEAALQEKRSQESETPEVEELDPTPQPVVKRGPATKIIGPKKPTTTQNGSSKKPSSSATSRRSQTTTPRRSSRRKRARKGDTEDEAEPSEEDEPSPKKRVRSKAPVAVPAPTRTLRPRTSKTAAQLAEEREVEEAFKSATSQ